MQPNRFVLLALGYLVSQPVSALNFNFTSDTGLSAEAQQALGRAGQQWSSHLLDSVTINVKVNMSNMGNAQVIGNAGSHLLTSSYTNFRQWLVDDAANETDDGIVSYLPTGSQASAYVPQNFTLNGLMSTKANFKALGDTPDFSTLLDNLFGTLDGVINFNSGFAFDYNSADGISANSMDFETVAAHEIGHILGFVSVVDEIDSMLNANQAGQITPYLLDLFRFGLNANPVNTLDFSTMPRDLRPAVASYFDDLSIQVAFSTGEFTGDGRQASHWQDTAGNSLGIMDPTLAYRQIVGISNFDLRALDVIGYEVTAVPLPGTVWAFATGLLGLWLGRKRS